MLLSIVLVTSFVFALTYPLCFFLSLDTPLKNNFHHFHIGTPAVVCSVMATTLLFQPVGIFAKWCIVGWAVSLLILARVGWRRETVSLPGLFLVTVIGMGGFVQVHSAYISSSPVAIAVSILAGLIFSAAFYAMNLGHWYLNMHGLSLTHLYRATYALRILLAARFLWDLFVLMTQSISYRYETISLLQFLFKTDGFLLWIPFLFGLIFPIFSLFLVKETLKLRNTQSSTGILYVILSAILLADFAYKYYLIKFGIIL